MSKIGDFKWDQLSQWDFAPNECVETYVKSECGKHIFHYVLKICYAVISERHTKWEVVKYLDNLPKDVLNFGGGTAKEKKPKVAGVRMSKSERQDAEINKLYDRLQEAHEERDKYKTEIKKAFWSGFEIAKTFEDMSIQTRWLEYEKLRGICE